MSFLDRFRSTKEPEVSPMRDLLFGDRPLAQWPPSDSSSASSEPWASFVAAREALTRNDEPAAIGHLRRVTDMPDLESRQYLQAWHCLRMLKVQPPPEKTKQLLGVVIEAQVESGVDYLAAYADRSARYFNYSGAAIIWERPDTSLDGEIDALFEVGQHILDAIGPWEKRRPPAPGRGEARINLLAPSGLHFGQGRFDVLSRDPVAGAVLNAGVVLMTAMMAKTREADAEQSKDGR